VESGLSRALPVLCPDTRTQRFWPLSAYCPRMRMPVREYECVVFRVSPTPTGLRSRCEFRAEGHGYFWVALIVVSANSAEPVWGGIGRFEAASDRRRSAPWRRASRPVARMEVDG